MAQRHGWRVVLRIEDLDGPRIKPGAVESIEATFRWLGIGWSGQPIVQSADLSPYFEAMKSLAARGLVYPCELTRAEIEAAASAPQETAVGASAEVRFPASLRPVDWNMPRAFSDMGTNWRFATPSAAVEFQDRFVGTGPTKINPSETIGDFIVWTKRGTPAYQLAVVVDDARQVVTEVVRGADLVDSAARQILLYESLGLTPRPRYTHVPLVVGTDGRRLAKRHGDSRVEMYREAGVPAEAVIGLMGFWSGITGRRSRLSCREFVDGFDLRRLPRGPAVFTAEDDVWLRSQAR